MKIPNFPGEYGFRALFAYYIKLSDKWIFDGWKLSDQYFLTEEEVISEAGRNSRSYKWPVEVNENGSVYIPDVSELE